MSNAAAQCACVADGRVNVCATIARNDLIAHLDGASGCGCKDAQLGSARAVDEDCDWCEDISGAAIV